MTREPASRIVDSSLVLRTLTVILLSGGSLLAALRAPTDMITTSYLAALGVLWGALALEAVPLGGWLTRTRRDVALVTVDIVAVGLVVTTVPELPGVSIYFLGPVATAAVRLGREGATAAAAAAALGLLLPAMFDQAGLRPVDATTAVGAVLLLTSGLAAGELVRLADHRRRRQDEAEANSQRVGQELERIVDNLGSGLVTVDVTGRITRSNPAARRILGLSDSDAARARFAEALGPDGRALSDLVLAALADGERRKRAEVTIVRGGQAVPLGVNVDFLTGADEVLMGAVVVFSDLAEVQRLREHLRRSDRLAGVGELAASIAHELRNPLASIRGSVELLAADLEVTDHHAQLMQLILRESNRLNTIITEFLDFARLRAPQPTATPLARFLDDIELQLQQHVKAEGTDIDVACATATPDLSIEADPEQLRQALLNLAINACEAMQGQGRLEVTAARIDDACELRVHDTGPGLAPERLEEIFTPFVTTKLNGTGLGLPMVARIVHGHGGTVEAENNPGGGADFVLRLPLAGSNARRVGAETNEEHDAPALVH